MLQRLERSALAVGAILVGAGAGVGFGDYFTQKARIAAFADPAVFWNEPYADRLAVAAPDKSDWSQARISKFLQLQSDRELPAAVLRIPALRIEAEILEDTADRSLDLGVGLIEGTAAPGESGNIGIAGHRDGFFRRLKDIQPGQRVEIFTRRGRWVYEVEATSIVMPDAVEVLAPSPTPRLTLVTCYPFYFMGKAPRRFIVHARLAPTSFATPHTRKDLT